MYGLVSWHTIWDLFAKCTNWQAEKNRILNIDAFEKKNGSTYVTSSFEYKYFKIALFKLFVLKNSDKGWKLKVSTTLAAFNFYKARICF